MAAKLGGHIHLVLNMKLAPEKRDTQRQSDERKIVTNADKSGQLFIYTRFHPNLRGAIPSKDDVAIHL